MAGDVETEGPGETLTLGDGCGELEGTGEEEGDGFAEGGSARGLGEGCPQGGFMYFPVMLIKVAMGGNGPLSWMSHVTTMWVAAASAARSSDSWQTAGEGFGGLREGGTSSRRRKRRA